MSKASRRTGSGAPDRSERWRSRTAVLLTALLHLLLVLLVLMAPPITTAPPPEGGTAGSRMEVTFIDETLRPPTPARKPVPKTTPPRKPAKPAPSAQRIRTTLVKQADTSVATEAADPADTPPATESVPSPGEPPSSPPAAPDDSTPPPPQPWGQPPGMLPRETAPVNAGSGASSATGRGRRNDASSGTSMEVGGYQVYYDLVSETRLRAWRDQGMTEVFLPLPGTRRLMVCPLEIALHRDSGKCRMIEPDSPERTAIGDARDVLNMQKVYKLGEELWSGPGAYR